MELRHLRYFQAVAEEASFGAAAKRLHISQPPLSRQIRALEDEMDVVLFVRGRHGAKLTAAGESFYRATKRLLAELGGAVTEARAAGAGKTGRVRIGYSQAGSKLLGTTLPALRREGNSARIDLEEMTAVQQAEALHGNRLDIALGYSLPPLDTQDIHSKRVQRTPMRIALPSPWRRRYASDPSCLSKLDLLFLPQSTAPDLHGRALSSLRRLGIRPNTVREINAVRSVFLLIGAGDGFGLVPECIDVPAGMGITLIDNPALRLHSETWVFWRQLRPAAQTVLECLCRVGA